MLLNLLLFLTFFSSSFVTIFLVRGFAELLIYPLWKTHLLYQDVLIAMVEFSLFCERIRFIKFGRKLPKITQKQLPLAIFPDDTCCLNPLLKWMVFVIPCGAPSDPLSLCYKCLAVWIEFVHLQLRKDRQHGNKRLFISFCGAWLGSPDLCIYLLPGSVSIYPGHLWPSSRSLTLLPLAQINYPRYLWFNKHYTIDITMNCLCLCLSLVRLATS